MLNLMCAQCGLITVALGKQYLKDSPRIQIFTVINRAVTIIFSSKHQKPAAAGNDLATTHTKSCNLFIAYSSLKYSCSLLF